MRSMVEHAVRREAGGQCSDRSAVLDEWPHVLDIRFTVPTLAFAIPAAALVLSLTAVRLRRAGTTRVHRVWVLASALYLVAVASVVFFPFQVNIGPYAGQTPWWSSVNVFPIITIDVETFLLNIVMFVPLGVVLTLMTRWQTLGGVLLVGALASVGIELAQIAFGVIGGTRTADVNDVIANTIGAGVGFAVAAGIARSATLRRLAPLQRA